MDRWANNYYSQQVGKDSSRPTPAPATSLSSSHSRRSSHVKTKSNGVVSLCVFRVSHLNQLTLRSFIEWQGVQVLNIEQTSHKGTAYKSFVVTVMERDAPKLLSRSFWPGLVACRPLQDGDPCHNDVFSRRYARDVVLPTSNADKSPRDARRSSKSGGTLTGHDLVEEPRSVHPMASQPYGTGKVNKQVRRGNKKANVNNPKKNERKNNKEPTSIKNSSVEKKSISATHKASKSAKLAGRTATIKVKQKNSGENTQRRQDLNYVENVKTHVTNIITRTRKLNFTNFPHISKSRKPKTESAVSRKNSKSERKLDNEKISEGKVHQAKSSVISTPTAHISLPGPQPRISTVNKKYKRVLNSTELTHNSKDNFRKPQGIQSNWVTPLKGLLNVSSEKALDRLLGPDFDRLLIQNNISDDELFLGIRVMGHCARADVSPNMQQQLVYRICQPQVISLIKEFTRTVEDKYKEKAESYFWDLGEFLDLYIVHSIFIQGMLSLFTACLSKILALNYRRYVSNDLVKVYRGMQTKVFANLP